MDKKNVEKNNVKDIKFIENARKPEGDLGDKILNRMNFSHEQLARWVCSHLTIDEGDYILDIGCGGGVNVDRFANKVAPNGKVVGIDYSKVSVEKTKNRNKKAIQEGIVDVLEGSVSKMPFKDNYFDLITGFETIYFWPDFVNDLKEVNRVLKKGGTVCFGNEVRYEDGQMDKYKEWMDGSYMKIYTDDELQSALLQAGFEDIELNKKDGENWICIKATKI